MTQAATDSSAAANTPAGRRPALTRQGVVTSDKRVRTRTVAVDFQSRHPKYGKYITHQVKYHVHDEDNVSKSGDRVEISPCRPLSKTKSWRLVRVVEAAPEPVTHKVAEDTAVEEQFETSDYHPGEQEENEQAEQEQQ
jgi:small subunit ribosomal protein S17